MDGPSRSARHLAPIGLVALALVATAVVGFGMASPELPNQTSTATSTADPASVGTALAGQTVTTVDITQTFAALPERPGRVESTRRFEIPNNVESLRTTLPEGASVSETAGGFSRVDERRYEWTGGDRGPSITYTFPVNETGQVAGPEGADGRYLFADVGEWGLFRRPGTPTDVRYRGSAIRFEEHATTSGPGAAGDWIVFVGESEETRRSAHGQTFRFVEPTTADLVESREAILASVTHASDALRVGDRDESVLMVAAPASVDWAVEGLQTGDSDLYVTADERVDDPNNVWLHEYVHTRQDFETTRDAQWVTEASATYYAALLTLEQDRIDFDAFGRYLEIGTNARYADVVLAEPETWTYGATYRKGALVAGELDRRLRLATDSRGELQTVLRRLNERTDPVDATDLVALFDDAGTADVAATAERYTTTNGHPDMWGPSEHGAAFARLPARFRVALPGEVPDAAYRVGGRFRNRTLGEPPFVLVPGETLSLDVRITNVGGTDGTYELTYGVENGSLHSRSRSVAAGETVTESIDVTIDALGNTALHVGEQRTPLTVVEPADLVVEDVQVDPRTVTAGETVDVVVDVTNPTDRPGQREIAVTRDGEPAASETVRLDAGKSRTVVLGVRLSDGGTHRLAVGDRVVTATVASQSGGTGTTGPGFGPVGVAIALLVLTAIARLRVSRR